MLAIVASASLLSSVSWASTGACSTKEDLAFYAPQGTAAGCYETDQTFSNFAVANGSAGTGSTAQTTSTVDIAGSTTFAAVNNPWTVTSTFSGATAADWEEVNGTVGANTQGTLTYLTNTTQAEFAVTGYPTPTAGAKIVISGLSLTAAATDGTNAADAITVTEIFCIGASACTTGTSGNEITLTASYSGSGDTTASYSCATLGGAQATCGTAGPSATPITVTFALPQTTLNFSDTYDLVAHGATTDTLTDFLNTFNTEETPEPSTFVLLGTALTGLGFLRLRKKA
jgi:hypothetical protein